jgi:asparagine synthase (glutamine-hydrolysing)
VTLPAGCLAAGRLELGGAPAQAGRLCAFDGFLDNAAQLRRELGGREPTVGEGLEPLLLAAWARWGDELPARLRGDFALLLWDGAAGTGLLARDQLGVRPLFIAPSGPVLRFAGEVRDLLAILPATPAPDPVGIAHWVALGNRTDSGTLYGGIERLGPGEMLRLGRDRWERRRYWAPRFEAPLSCSPEELAGRVRAGLDLAVERRLGPDGRTGVKMSGGLDSASIAAIAGPRALACSAVFPDHAAADERELIEGLRAALGLEGPIAEVRPGGLLARAVAHLAAWRVPQQGWGDFWALPLLRAAADAGVATVLGGDGGDELFGPRVYALADAVRAGRPGRVMRLARRLPGAGPHVGRRAEAAMIAGVGLAGALPPLPAGGPGGTFARGNPPAWVPRRVRRLIAAGDDPDAWKRLDGPRWWANAAYGLAHGIEAVGVLEHGRRTAAQAGLGLRHPMLDLDLVELALRQPPEATLDPRFSRPVLRAALAGTLPDSVRLRPAKARFESLIVSCLTGPDGAAIRDLLSAPDAAVAEYVDGPRMAAALFASAAPREADPFRWMWQVWRLLNMELWLRSLSGAKLLPEPDPPLQEASVRVAVG